MEDTIFYCDVCGEPLNSPDEGYVVWDMDENGVQSNFTIIHQSKCDDNKKMCSAPLNDFLGANGLARCLAFLSIGRVKKGLGENETRDIADMTNFVDFIRRVQTPNYEAARRHFDNEDMINAYNDANEVAPYLPQELFLINQRFS